MTRWMGSSSVGSGAMTLRDTSQWQATGSNTSLSSLLANLSAACVLSFASAGKTGSSGEVKESWDTPTSVVAVFVRERTHSTATLSPVGRVTDLRASKQTAERLLIARKRFSLTMQQLADVMGVTRQVVYRWRDGTAGPRRKHVERLASLVELAEYFAKAGGNTVGVGLHTNSENGLSLFQLLQEEKLRLPELRVLLDQLAVESRKLSTLERGDDVLGVFGHSSVRSRSTTDAEDDRIGSRPRYGPA